MELLEILRNEVKPALGCTGPISVAFATAAAKDAVGGTPKNIRVLMDKDTYKNSIAVVTPGTSFMGVLEPSVVGAFYGDSKLGMEVLANMKNPDEAFIRKFAKEHASGFSSAQSSPGNQTCALHERLHFRADGPEIGR